MTFYDWDTRFTDLFQRCADRYRSGDSDYSGYYDEADLAFLASFGYRPRELFDFVEDHADHEGEPSLGTALLVASARRDYFTVILGGRPGEQEITPEDLPDRDAELAGYRWLPRILAKARAKLRGELHPDIMYGCGGDRAFLREHDAHPADFLRVVWAAGDDDSKVADYLRQRSHG